LLSDGEGGGFFGGRMETLFSNYFLHENSLCQSEPRIHPTEKIKHKETPTISTKENKSLGIEFSSS
jgi:outer membrane receptor for ferric coprogen and ferric-rhodotorulic acid